MKLHRFTLGKLATMVLGIIAVMFLSGCEVLSSSQNTFSPSGSVAQKQYDLFIIVLIPAIIILIGVFVALFYILFRFRAKEGDPIPVQVHGNNRLEIGWTIAPAILLLVLAVPIVYRIIDLGGDFDDDAYEVRVEAFQWDWLFHYDEFTDAEGEPLSTSQLYIPVDRQVGVHLESANVIHSFWIPKLAGKQDIMPGRTNTLKFDAQEPGIYQGQCAEFCGLRHAFMRFNAVALEQPQLEECMASIAADGEDPVPAACEP